VDRRLEPLHFAPSILPFAFEGSFEIECDQVLSTKNVFYYYLVWGEGGLMGRGRGGVSGGWVAWGGVCGVCEGMRGGG